ncbi:hypothetical protein LVJ94_06530 [Pendulispora rubella]|uniref:Uncharacterized protein n=1 Tax=Pendulispora rubella TaxID=2741070 RepID=A0ABZ2L801_9BACT
MTRLGYVLASGAVMAIAVGCSSSDSNDNTPPKKTIAELAKCDESDIADDLPWSGVQIDANTGKLREPLPAGFVVATTVGWPTDEGRPVIQQKTIESIQISFTYPGLLAAKFGTSKHCGSGRSLSIWKDEASMMAWVIGKDHRAVMPLATTHTHGWETTHWSSPTNNELPSWDDARGKLDTARSGR